MTVLKNISSALRILATSREALNLHRYNLDRLSYSNEPLATEPTSYELLSFRHLTNVRKKSKFQGGSTSARICVAPAFK